MIETTRKYSRTLSEAFPDTRAECTEGWQRTGDRAVNWALAAGIVAVVLAICFGVPA